MTASANFSICAPVAASAATKASVRRVGTICLTRSALKTINDAARGGVVAAKRRASARDREPHVIAKLGLAPGQLWTALHCLCRRLSSTWPASGLCLQVEGRFFAGSLTPVSLASRANTQPVYWSPDMGYIHTAAKRRFHKPFVFEPFFVVILSKEKIRTNKNFSFSNNRTTFPSALPVGGNERNSLCVLVDHEGCYFD